MAGQDQKITQLSPLTSASADDLLVIVNDPSGTPLTQKITVDDLFSYLSEVGTNNTIAKFSLTGLADSSITDDGTTVAISTDLAVDTDTLFVDASTDRVGINTQSPSAALDVVGTTKLNGNTTINGDLSLDNFITVKSATNAYAYQNFGANSVYGWQVGRADNGGAIAPSNSFYFYDISASATRMFLDSSGNLSVDTDTLFVDATSNEVGIGTATPQTTLDINTTTGALLVPRLTTTQRNALTAVAGMIIYNTTTVKHEGYDGTTWNAFY